MGSLYDENDRRVSMRGWGNRQFTAIGGSSLTDMLEFELKVDRSQASWLTGASCCVTCVWRVDATRRLC